MCFVSMNGKLWKIAQLSYPIWSINFNGKNKNQLEKAACGASWLSYACYIQLNLIEIEKIFTQTDVSTKITAILQSWNFYFLCYKLNFDLESKKKSDCDTSCWYLILELSNKGWLDTFRLAETKQILCCQSNHSCWKDIGRRWLGHTFFILIFPNLATDPNSNVNSISEKYKKKFYNNIAIQDKSVSCHKKVQLQHRTLFTVHLHCIPKDIRIVTFICVAISHGEKKPILISNFRRTSF